MCNTLDVIKFNYKVLCKKNLSSIHSTLIDHIKTCMSMMSSAFSQGYNKALCCWCFDEFCTVPPNNTICSHNFLIAQCKVP